MSLFNDSSRRKRGSAVLNLNLVPFIDLFSSLVIFLVATAVWDKLAAVNLNMGVDDKPSVQMPKDLTKIKKIKSEFMIILQKENVDVFANGKLTRIILKDLPPKSTSNPNVKTSLPTRDFSEVEEFVAKVRAENPEKKDMLVKISDSAVYSDMVGILDLCLGKKFDELIVAGLEEGGL